MTQPTTVGTTVDTRTWWQTFTWQSSTTSSAASAPAATKETETKAEMTEEKPNVNLPSSSHPSECPSSCWGWKKVVMVVGLVGVTSGVARFYYAVPLIKSIALGLGVGIGLVGLSLMVCRGLKNRCAVGGASGDTSSHSTLWKRVTVLWTRTTTIPPATVNKS